MTKVKLDEREWAIVPLEDYERLARLATLAEAHPLPTAGEDGYFPAVEYARASIARTIVRERVRAGLTQRELARRAGVCVETLCRVEKGRNMASTATIARVDRALKQALRGKSRRLNPRRSTG